MITGSRNVSSIQFKSQGTTNGEESLPDREPTISVEPDSKAPGELGGGDKDATGEL